MCLNTMITLIMKYHRYTHRKKDFFETKKLFFQNHFSFKDKIRSNEKKFNCFNKKIIF